MVLCLVKGGCRYSMRKEKIQMKKKVIFLLLVICCGVSFFVYRRTQTKEYTVFYADEQGKSAVGDERYTIERIEGDNIKNSLGQAVVYGYYDKVVFGDSKYLACNQVIEKKAAEFQSQYENFKEQVKEADGAKSDYREGEFPYYDTCEVQNIEFWEDYISILFQTKWFAGGVNETDFEAVNMDKNGNEITIADILKKSDEESCEYAYETTSDFLKKNEIYDEMYMEILQEYKAEDYGFYLENGVCYLYFRQGEITYNAAGSFRIKLAEYQ